MAEEIKRNCNTCKSGRFARCDALKNNSDYQAIVNMPTGWMSAEYKFKESFICNDYRCRYIEYPIEVTGINRNTEQYSLNKGDIGKFVSIRPCAEECQGKTYLGLFLGDLPIDISVSHNPESGELNLSYFSNPAIFVFDLNKIVYGAESWWGVIESEDDLKQITQDTIDSQWYVRILKSLEAAGEDHTEGCKECEEQGKDNCSCINNPVPVADI
ncbi:hypothetical protein [Syntrophomonas palmitatica]|uniref:hypothetical protein n=1 Tax=Syntrophomonas palmitatica TaxID=402877 RepID=UPI000A496FC7|nr:hypothetical protein [Syntrophomonas palmitatica]